MKCCYFKTSQSSKVQCDVRGERFFFHRNLDYENLFLKSVLMFQAVFFSKLMFSKLMFSKLISISQRHKEQVGLVWTKSSAQRQYMFSLFTWLYIQFGSTFTWLYIHFNSVESVVWENLKSLMLHNHQCSCHVFGFDFS